jgi:hypothetical protein
LDKHTDQPRSDQRQKSAERQPSVGQGQKPQEAAEWKMQFPMYHRQATGSANVRPSRCKMYNWERAMGKGDNRASSTLGEQMEAQTRMDQGTVDIVETIGYNALALEVTLALQAIAWAGLQ